MSVCFGSIQDRLRSSGSNGRGDYAIAFSTSCNPQKLVANDDMSPLFLAVVEATEEAICNSLLRAVTITGNGHTVQALPIDRTVEILKKYHTLP